MTLRSLLNPGVMTLCVRGGQVGTAVGLLRAVQFLPDNFHFIHAASITSDW